MNHHILDPPVKSKIIIFFFRVDFLCNSAKNWYLFDFVHISNKSEQLTSKTNLEHSTDLQLNFILNDKRFIGENEWFD